jgi:hypothetical protein
LIVYDGTATKVDPYAIGFGYVRLNFVAGREIIPRQPTFTVRVRP